MAENDQNPEAQQQPAADSNQPVFVQQRYYLKDASFEAPNTPDVFKGNYNPKINFNLNNRTVKLEDGLYESILRLTADVQQDEKSVFLAEVQYAGIFEIRNLESEPMEMLLNINCPSLLFPYAKEALESMVIKASFPPLMLAPVNFEMVYQQAKAQQVQQGEEAGPDNPQ